MDTHNKTVEIDIDAFSDGQIGSKLWLCENLEKLIDLPQNIWIYGGWCGVLSLLLLSRNILPVNSIRSFDIDPRCEHAADILLEYWKIQKWKFKAMTADCNELQPYSNEHGNTPFGDAPTIVINTSSEHFISTKWFDNIAEGTLVAIQSNNMIHDDHFSNVASIDELKNLYPLSIYLMSDTKEFVYPSWRFERYMIIGYK